MPYQLADILLRLAPARADDAIAAGRLEEMLKAAVEQLESYIGSNPNGPQTPDALLKLGHCLQRQASLLVQPQERAKVYAAARGVYEQLNQRFPRSQQAPQAIFERARVMGLAGDVNGAMNELRRFSNEPLKNAPVAPMALLQLATLLRGQNKPAEAAEVLNQCRQAHEAKLNQDPARSGWVALLMYHQGVALREAGKRAEARALLDQVVRQTPDRPEAAEAGLRAGLCMKDDAQLKIAAAEKKLAMPGLKPEDVAAAGKALDEGVKDLKDAIVYLAGLADRVAQKQPAAEARAKMMYEAAWGYRTLADREIAAASKKMAQDLLQKRRDDLAKKLPPGQPVPNIPLPVVALKDLPLQPSETSARAQYQALIQAFPDLAANIDARFELAEMLSDRGEHDAAIKLLREALDKEPNPDLTDKVRIRLGVSLQAKGDTKAALNQFQTVAQNPKSAQLGHAVYRAGECLFQMGDHAEAVKRLARFRDEGPIPEYRGGVRQSALAFGARPGQTQAMGTEPASARAGGEPVPEQPLGGRGPLRHGLGAAKPAALRRGGQRLHAGGCHDVRRTGCQGPDEYRRVPAGPEALQRRHHGAPGGAVHLRLSAPERLSLVEAARAFAENKQPDQAIKLLERVLRDHPETEPSEVAKKRLEELKKG